MLTGHPGRAEGSVNSAGEPGARVALGAELELQFYPRGDGGPLKGSKRENGVIVSHPGKKMFDSQSPFPPSFPGTCSVGSVRKNREASLPVNFFPSSDKTLFV